MNDAMICPSCRGGRLESTTMGVDVVTGYDPNINTCRDCGYRWREYRPPEYPEPIKLDLRDGSVDPDFLRGAPYDLDAPGVKVKR